LELIGAARERGVRSVSVLDFWGHYKERFRLAQREVLPDAIAIMDERARREMLSQGFSPEILHVTGQPAFDVLDECDTPAAREAARELVGRRLGGGSDLRSVVYVSQPLARLFGHERLGFVEGDVLTAVTSSLAEIVERRHARAGLLVKRHPREVGTDVPGPGSPSPRLTVEVIPDDDPTDARVWVLGCDLVVGMSSMLLMEACLLRQPVVSFQPGLKEPDTLPSNAMGWSRAVYDRAELQRALESEMFDPEIRSERRRRLAAIERPRGATERVIALLGERSA
jgi:UDP-N-acetylglucosamine 2-epimerase